MNRVIVFGRFWNTEPRKSGRRIKGKSENSENIKSESPSPHLVTLLDSAYWALSVRFSLLASFWPAKSLQKGHQNQPQIPTLLHHKQ